MFKAGEIIEATKGRLLAGNAGAVVKGVSTNSRAIRKGDLFIAIKGPRFDGHSFAREAANKGASGILLCSKSSFAREFESGAWKVKPFIAACKDTVKALGDLAHFYRSRFDIPLVAVTGSNGKTATKDMISRVLDNGWYPLKSSGTLNNSIGVPLTLLKLSGKNKSAVIELGMNAPGEIKRLALISMPNIGVITNIGPSHLEYLKNLEGVFRAKKELLDHLGAGDIAVLNNDDLFLRSYSKKGLRAVTFGIKRESDFRAKELKKQANSWRFTVEGNPYTVTSAAYHDIYNALAAIAVGRIFDLRHKEIATALKKYRPLDKRMSMSVYRGVEIIDDTYNSNPASLKNAVKALAGYKTNGRRILVAGDMLELGQRSGYYHKRFGKAVAGSGIDFFLTVGRQSHKSFLAARRSGMKKAASCATKEEAALILKKFTRADDVVLVKGSRGSKMEDVIKCFITSFIR